MKASASASIVSHRRLLLRISSMVGALLVCSPALALESKPDTKSEPKVSYYRQIRPILQANCQGCHQPAKSKGGYVMTDFKGLLAGGDTEGAAIVPKHADKSAIIKMITPQDGEVRMPKGKTPLLDSEIALMSAW